MHDGLLQRMSWLHTWLGLLVSWVAYFVFLTGTAAYLDTEIDRWMRPELPLRSPANKVSAHESINRAYEFLRSEPAAHSALRWNIIPPRGHEQPFLQASWRHMTASGRPFTSTVLFDGDGKPLPQARATGGGYALYRLHVELHYLPRRTGFIIVGVC